MFLFEYVYMLGRDYLLENNMERIFSNVAC